MGGYVMKTALDALYGHLLRFLHFLLLGLIKKYPASLLSGISVYFHFCFIYSLAYSYRVPFTSDC